MQRPFCSIIDVRGWAGNEGESEDAVAERCMSWIAGSAMVRRDLHEGE